DCEKDIRYIILNEYKETTVSLTASFNNDIIFLGYILRNKDVEIGLEDYSKSAGSGSGVMGGSVTTERGIHCSMKLECSYEDVGTLEEIKDTIQEFYGSPENLERKEIIEKWAKEKKTG
ncbi:MAG: hypothetical protein JRI49_09290, partial [Deltaproteobacteria bacterium]|nr:hypothetical protein [Deltaproteobacteria bacterium]